MNFEAMRVLDESKMLADLQALGRHWRHATEIAEGADLNDDLRGARQIVWGGMGGSAIGGDLLQAAAGDELGIPVIANRGYELPTFVGPETLVIAASYSGNTEETLSVVEQAQKAGAKLLCMTTGGELLRICRERDVPHIAIPGGLQPRCGVLYLFTPVLTTLARLGYLSADKLRADGEETATMLASKAESYGREDGAAARLARTLDGKLPVLYASSHIGAAVMRWQTQINENANMLLHYNLLPEMNHNEIVGWQHPAESIRNMHVLFLRDKDEHKRVGQRLDLTEKLLTDEGAAAGVTTVSSEGVSRVARVFSLLILGDFTSYYLALLNGVDPSPVGRIERFKKLLADMPR